MGVKVFLHAFES